MANTGSVTARIGLTGADHVKGRVYSDVAEIVEFVEGYAATDLNFVDLNIRVASDDLQGRSWAEAIMDTVLRCVERIEKELHELQQ